MEEVLTKDGKPVGKRKIYNKDGSLKEVIEY